MLSLQHADPIKWPMPFAKLVWVGLTFTALKRAADLIVEGDEMRNCAATYLEHCLAGNVLLVAVALPSGKRIATADYQRAASGWQLTSAKGPANRVLKLGLERLIDQFATQIPTDSKTSTPQAPMTETHDVGHLHYHNTMEFLGMPDTNHPRYIGTAPAPVTYQIRTSAYGEMSAWGASRSPSANAFSASSTDQST